MLSQAVFGWLSKISTQKANPGIDSPLSRQVFSHPLESRAPARVMVTWEDKVRHSKHPLLLPPFYWARWQMVCNIPLVSWGHPGCVSSHPPRHPHLPHQLGKWMKSRKGPGSVQALVSNNKKYLYAINSVFTQIQNTAPYQPLWTKLPQPKPHTLSDPIR